MDSWFVAAVAATGYFAKYWQNLSRDKNGYPKLFSVDSRIGKADSGKGPFHKSARRRKLQEDVSSEGRQVSDSKLSDIYRQNVASAAEVDSASGFDSEKVGSLGNHIDRDVISQSSLSPGFLRNENLGKDQCGKGLGTNSGGNTAKPSITRMESFNVSTRKRSSLKTKYPYGQVHKPLTSLDSCLMAQLYMQHVKMEECILSSPPSLPTPILRPLPSFTDGSRIISRAIGEFPNESNGTEDSKLHNQATFEKSGHVFGIPPLPEIKSLNLPKKLKFKRGNGCDNRLSIPCKMDTEKQFHSQCYTHDGAVLIFLGISIAMISSYIGNRRELEKLREMLKQTENLVQDLQEELEMKDSLTMKELANENYESWGTYENSFQDRATNSSSLEQNMNNSTRYDGKGSYNEKVEESSESLSKIEAELEAELERLGLNMNVSNLERKLSDLDELDPDFAEGELRSDMINGQALVQFVSNEDRSGTSTTRSGNYAVSPRELRLRLHEVIQAKLEERVQELETALQNSQRKVKLMESEHKNSRKNSDSEWKYSSTLESPPINEEFDCMSNPLVMKLSGEALDAYNEACEELLKEDELEEDDSASYIYQNNHQEELHRFDGDISWGGQNVVGGSLRHLTLYAKNISEEPFYCQGRTLGKQPSSVQELLDVGVSEDDECSDWDYEMEKQLIQHIVEKTKKGSPVLLNAQRILFSMDEI